MSKVDISKIKPGDEVQVANGVWYKVESIDRHLAIVSNGGWPRGITPRFITAHKPAKPEPPVPEVKQ